MNEWLTSFEQRILPFMKAKSVLDDSEIVRLGKKVSNEYPLLFQLCMDDVLTDACLLE